MNLFRIAVRVAVSATITHERQGLSHIRLPAYDENGQPETVYAGSMEDSDNSIKFKPSSLSAAQIKSAEQLSKKAWIKGKFPMIEALV